MKHILALIVLLPTFVSAASSADVVRYRGVMSPDIPVEADIRDLAAMGGNLMRFQMNGNGVTKPAKVETKEEKLAWFDTWIAAKLDLLERSLIPWARQYGVKLVVDMHDSPGGRDREHDSQVCMYYDADYAAKFVATWREIARRFAGHEDVIYGYDLFNEPNEQQEPLPDCDYWNLQVRAGKAVRESDTKTPIIIAAKNWDLSRGFRQLKPVPIDNVIYQVHVYDPHEFTHQGLGNDNWTRYPGVDPKTGRTYNKDFLREAISPVVAFQREHGVKIYVGEFSALGYADGAADYIRDVISLLEEQGWDWTYHAWREWSGWSVEHVCTDRLSKTFVPATVETDRMRVLKEGLAGRIKGREDLHDLFAAPPKSAKLQAIWHWMGDNIRAEAIVRDLQAMKDIDIDTVCIIAPHMVWMPYEVRCMSPKWLELFTLAISEAKRHGITLGFHNCPGWSASGGPWIDAAHSMKTVVSTNAVVVSDGTTAVPALPQPATKHDFYRDLGVWAFPEGKDPRVVADPARALENPTTLPAGTWRVVRVGYTTTGKGPAPSTLKGLECDKFSTEALDIHWQAMPAKILALPGAKGTVDFCFIDSFEAGLQNWSENLPAEFEKKYGRAIGVDVLTLAGYRVGSEADHARHKKEFHDLFGELIARNYYGHFTELCHRAGIRSAVEPYGAECPMGEATRRVDVPTAEFWLGRPMADPECPRKVSDAALDAGLEIVAAESFTTDAKSGRWQVTPEDLRRAGDFQAWIKGVNQIVHHSYVMQPYVNLRPGMSLGQHGSQLNVNTPWWPEALGWSRYVARGQSLLQAGKRYRGPVSVPQPLKAIRRDYGKDRIYFLVNDSAKTYTGAVAMSHEEGTVPEFFNAIDGSVTPAPCNPASQVELTLAPSGSVFIVWSETGKTFAPIRAPEALERELTDDWEIVSFDGVAAPEPRPIGRLIDWSKSDDERLRYFAGRARYRHRLDTTGERTLDFGDVRDVANVYVDGAKVACLWQKPYVTRIPAGRVLEVEVINTWPNRLIGDAVIRSRGAAEPMPPTGPRFPLWVTEGRANSGTGISTWSNFVEAWTPNDPLRPAGLLGPVRVLGPKPADVVVDPRVRTFVNPTRIVDAEKVARGETLLRERFGQVSEGRFTAGSAAVIQPGGRLVLDYGRELHGALQLGCGPQSGHAALVRVRFGESVAEAIAPLGQKGAMNDHAIRDGAIDLPWFGQREIGNTGFRFVALENVGEKDLFVEFARAVSLMRPWTRRGDFYSSDARVNAVFETSVRTAHLCSQEYLWDGIKRDRLVWIGDFHPEVNVILSVFGAEDVLEKSLEYAIRTTPPDTWANGMSSYTCWLVRDIHDLWYGTGDLAFVRRHADYLRKTTDHLAEHVDANGLCTLPSKFLDWPTRHNEAGEAAGCQALMAMAFDDLAELATGLGDDAWAAKARDCAARLRTRHPDPSGSKQAAALLALGGLQDAETMYETVLGQNGCAGVSTFYGYYMLEAMSRSGHGARALETVRDYWGGMLDVGATSFWEDFNLAWTNNCFRIDEMPVPGKKDIHGDYGEFCYRGFRHSLCHGWSSGPAHWLIAHALGLTFAEPGGRTVRFAPESVGLAWAEGALATPFGPVRVRVERQADGSVAGRVISAPAEVKVVGP